MDPIIDLRLANDRRADFERRAADHRLARSVRPSRRIALARVWVRATAPTAPASHAGTPLSCCPA